MSTPPDALEGAPETNTTFHEPDVESGKEVVDDDGVVVVGTQKTNEEEKKKRREIYVLLAIVLSVAVLLAVVVPIFATSGGGDDDTVVARSNVPKTPKAGQKMDTVENLVVILEGISPMNENGQNVFEVEVAKSVEKFWNDEEVGGGKKRVLLQAGEVFDVTAVINVTAQDPPSFVDNGRRVRRRRTTEKKTVSVTYMQTTTYRTASSTAADVTPEELAIGPFETLTNRQAMADALRVAHPSTFGNLTTISEVTIYESASTPTLSATLPTTTPSTTPTTSSPTSPTTSPTQPLTSVSPTTKTPSKSPTVSPTNTTPTTQSPTTPSPTTASPTTQPNNPTHSPSTSTTPPTVSLAPTPSPTQTWSQVGSDIGGNGDGNIATKDNFGKSVSLSNDGKRLVIGAPDHNSNSGLVRVYEEKQQGNWTQIGYDLHGHSSFDYFGYSVEMSGDGNRIVVGAPMADNGNVVGGGSASGEVKVFELQSGNWTLLGRPILGNSGGDWSGWSISTSYDGNLVAIGAYRNDLRRGKVRVYEYSSTFNNWTQFGQDIDGDTTHDEFGYSISLSDDGLVLAIGARSKDGINGTDSGSVCVYENKSDGTWTQRGQDLDGENQGDQSGSSVSLSSDGTVVAVGARYNHGGGNGGRYRSGHVRVFQYNTQTKLWSQVGSDIDGEAPNDESGSSKSISLARNGTVLAVGARLNDGNGVSSGHVRIYSYNNNNNNGTNNNNNEWTRVGGDIDGKASGDYAGSSISLSLNGRRIAVGSPCNDDYGNDSGHVRVYDFYGNL